MKKIISVILALIIGVTMFGINADAASYDVKISSTYKNGYTYVTLKPTNGTVYYTTDGTKPDKSDKKYTGKFKVTKPSKLRMAVYSGGKAVERLSAEIDVRVKAPELEVSQYSEGCYKIVVSAAKGATVYYTTNGKTPSKKNGIKLSSSGKIFVDAGITVKAIAVKDGWKSSKVVTKTMPKTEIKVAKSTKEEYIEEVLRLVNIERKKNGVSELKTTDALSEAADIRAKELIEKYDHTRPDGRDCFTVLAECNIPFGAVGENIAAGYNTPARVVKGWMNSPGHRKNILNSKYSKIGIGYSECNDTYGTYWVQVFTD